MAKFDLYAPILKRLEGGFSNHPYDKGGATNCGVTLKTFRYYYGSDKTETDLRHMTDAQWTRIMRTYWDECKADNILNQSIANIVVDWNVNSGLSGRKEVQRTFNLVADGIFGVKTLSALNSNPQKCVFCKIRDAREKFYLNLAEKTPSQKVFLNGWMNRLNQFHYEG